MNKGVNTVYTMVKKLRELNEKPIAVVQGAERYKQVSVITYGLLHHIVGCSGCNKYCIQSVSRPSARA